MPSHQSGKPTGTGQKGPADTSAFNRVVKSRAFIVTVVVLTLYTLGGFLLAPYLVERYVPNILEKKLRCEATIGDVRINPFLFTFEANKFRLFEPDGSHVTGFDRLFLDFEPSGLFRWAWTFKAFKLENPKVSVVIGRDGGLNFQRLIPDKPAAEPQPEPQGAGDEDAAPPRLLVQNIALQNGVIYVTDLRQSEPARVEITPLNIRLERISTLREHKGPYSLKADLNDGGALAWTGTVTLHPLKSVGNLGFSDINVSTLWKFARDSLNIQEPGGKLNFHMDYALDMSGGKTELTLDNLSLLFVDLAARLSGDDAPFFSLAEASISDTRFDLNTRKLDIGTVIINNGAARVFIDADGVPNLQKIVVQSTPQENDMSSDNQPVANTASSGEANRPWDVKVNAVKIDGIALELEDRSRSLGLAAGFAEFRAGFSVRAQAGGSNTQLKAAGIDVGLRSVHLGRLGEPEAIFRLPSLQLENGAFDLKPQSFTADRILLSKGYIDLVREPDGGLNLLNLFASSQGDPTEQPTVKTSEEKENAFSFLINKVDLAEFTTAISDRTVKNSGTIVVMEEMNVELENVDGRSPMDIFLEFELDQGGSVGVSGVVDPAAPSIKTEVNLTEIALKVLQPYIEPHVAVQLHSGVFSTRGSFDYNDPATEGDLAYDGRFNVSRLDIRGAGSEETLLGWQRLKASNITFGLNPDLLEIPDLSLVGLDGKFVIAKDGSTNLSRLVKSDKKPPEEAESRVESEQPGEPVFPVFINKLRVEDGQFYFADLNLRPQFSTRMHDLDGLVIGIASAPDARAQVQVDGQVDEYGLARIQGEISLFEPVSYTDIAMVFQNLEMNNMTPYSGKFVGRRIDSGKLSLDLKYKVEEAKLKGDNQIVVDNLTLGERVESSDAIQLPLNLAIAILEDENGIIDIGMPVSGDLNDPKFSYGHLIWKALANLMKKIVTSPFRALGAMLGEDTEGLDAIAFDSGSYEVPPPEKEKIHRLAEALNKRPQLKVVVQGRYHPELDGRELRALQVRRSLAAGLGVELEPREDPGPPDYGNPKVQHALETMYTDRFSVEKLAELKEDLLSPAPVEEGQKDAEGTETTVAAVSTPEQPEDPGFVSKELYAVLVAEEPLEENVLVTLADTRAQAIVFEMVDAGRLVPERIVTKASEKLADDEVVTAKLELDAIKSD